MPPARRERLQRTLAVLESQRFFVADDADEAADADGRLDFAFDNCAAAAEAFRQRLPELVALAKAMAIAELEVPGALCRSRTRPVLRGFRRERADRQDLARFPDYLVCIPPDRNDAPENANLMEMLSVGLPVKVLVQIDDLLEEASIGTGRFAFGVRSARLATAAMGLGGMFVLQSASANL